MFKFYYNVIFQIQGEQTLFHTSLEIQDNRTVMMGLCIIIIIALPHSVVGASLKKSCTPNEIYTFGIMHNSFP